MITTFAAICLAQTYNQDISVGITRTVAKAPPLSITPKAKFLVSIFNGTKNSTAILSDACSWGYGSMSFELQDSTGKIYRITRVPKAWDKNAPTGEVLPSLGVIIRKIDFGDKTWTGFPTGVTAPADGWKARVLLVAPRLEIITERPFWAGSIQSNWVPATMVERAN